MAEKPEKDESEEQQPGVWDIVKSTLAGALGVQSSKNRERDFKHGSIKVFIAAGVIFTLIFIAVVITVVKLVLRSAGM